MRSAVSAQLGKLRPLRPATATVAKGLTAARSYLRYLGLAATAYEESYRAAVAGNGSGSTRSFAVCRSRYGQATAAWRRVRALLWPGT